LVLQQQSILSGIKLRISIYILPLSLPASTLSPPRLLMYLCTSTCYMCYYLAEGVVLHVGHITVHFALVHLAGKKDARMCEELERESEEVRERKSKRERESKRERDWETGFVHVRINTLHINYGYINSSVLSSLLPF